MSTISENLTSSNLRELSHKTGLVMSRSTDEALEDLFNKLESYDEAERAETFAYLKGALNQTRASIGAEPVFTNE